MSEEIKKEEFDMNATMNKLFRAECLACKGIL